MGNGFVSVPVFIAVVAVILGAGFMTATSKLEEVETRMNASVSAVRADLDTAQGTISTLSSSLQAAVTKLRATENDLQMAQADLSVLNKAKVVTLANINHGNVFSNQPANVWTPIAGLNYKGNFDVDMRVIVEVHFHTHVAPGSRVDVGVFKDGKIVNLMGQGGSHWPGTAVMFPSEWVTQTALVVLDLPKGIDFEIDARALIYNGGTVNVNGAGLVLDFRPKLGA